MFLALELHLSDINSSNWGPCRYFFLSEWTCSNILMQYENNVISPMLLLVSEYKKSVQNYVISRVMMMEIA